MTPTQFNRALKTLGYLPTSKKTSADFGLSVGQLLRIKSGRAKPSRMFELLVAEKLENRRLRITSGEKE